MADKKTKAPPSEQAAPEPVKHGASDDLHAEGVPASSPLGDVVVPFEKISELIGEKKAAARAGAAREDAAKAETVPEQAEAAPDTRPPREKATAEPEAEQAQAKPRRGRPPKAKAAPETEAAQKPRRGRPPKTDKAAPDKAAAPRDKVSRGKKEQPTPEKPPEKAAEPSAVEPLESAEPPRPMAEGKVVYVKISELHPFHTFREHPYKVTDDERMNELVGTIKEHGVMTPITVRPEKSGVGYEIIAGHRRCHGSERAGLDEIPCIIREMSDLEAVREMRISNKQRGDPLPSELARLLDLEMEALKHQGGQLAGVAPGDVGKRSAEIVGENNGMNYKKVMRYVRLNSLVPELLDMVDAKKIGFMPAVELSYVSKRNQRLIAVSIDGEQSSPSVAQAKKLRELDQSNKLTGDVIDGILCEEKKEVERVIISTEELGKYFGREVTPRQMKDQIIALLDEWKAKQPPEKAAPVKPAERG